MSILITLFVLLFFGYFAVAFLSQVGIIDIQTGLEMLSVFSSTVLTLSLILIYLDIAESSKIQNKLARDQASLQQDQNEMQEDLIQLQESQRDVMAAAHDPNIEPVKVDIESSESPEFGITFENSGNGMARDMRIKPELHTTRGPKGFQGTVPVNEILGYTNNNPEGYYGSIKPLRRANSDFSPSNGASLQSGETVSFEFELYFEKRKFSHAEEDVIVDSYIPLSEMISKLPDETLIINLELIYSTALGDHKRNIFHSAEIDPNKEMTIAKMMFG